MAAARGLSAPSSTAEPLTSPFVTPRPPTLAAVRSHCGVARAAFVIAALVVAAAAGSGCGDRPGDTPAEGDTLEFAALPLASPRLAPERHFTARDGTELSVRTYGERAPVDLVLVHGSGAWNAYLADLAAVIADAGVAVVHTPDLRGHGRAPARRGDIDYVAQLEDDLADWIALLREARPERLVVVGGHSSGGGLAIRFAGGEHAALADGFLLLAPYLGHDAPTTRAGSGGWARPRTGRIVLLSILAGFGIRALQGMTVLEFAMPEAARTGQETLAYSYRMMAGINPRDHASDLAAMRAPVLVLIGSDDEAFVADAYPAVFAEHAPHARVERIEGVSHLGLVAHPETAQRAIAWLGALAAEAAARRREPVPGGGAVTVMR